MADHWAVCLATEKVATLAVLMVQWWAVQMVLRMVGLKAGPKALRSAVPRENLLESVTVD